MSSAGPIARDPAQRLARAELSKGIYHQPSQSLTERIVSDIVSFLERVFAYASQATPGGWWTIVALAAIVVAVAAVVFTRIGPLAGSARAADQGGTLGGRPLTARLLRAAAEASAAQGEYGPAIVERLRAIAAAAEENGALVPDAGRTADEFAAAAGGRYPAYRGELAAAARLFDQIRYGDGTGTRDGYERLRVLDDAIGRLSPESAREDSGAGTRAGGPGQPAVRL